MLRIVFQRVMITSLNHATNIGRSGFAVEVNLAEESYKPLEEDDNILEEKIDFEVEFSEEKAGEEKERHLP